MLLLVTLPVRIGFILITLSVSTKGVEMWYPVKPPTGQIGLLLIKAVKVIFSLAVIVVCAVYVKAELNRAFYPMPLYSANLVGLSVIALVLLWRK